MAEGVVVRLEVIDVEQDQGHVAAMAPPAARLVLEAFLEGAAVPELRQAVERRQLGQLAVRFLQHVLLLPELALRILQPPLVLLAVGDVARRNLQLDHLPGIVQHRTPHHLEPEVATRLVQHADLDRCDRLAAQELVEVPLQPVQVLRMDGGERRHPRHFLGEEAQDALAGWADVDDPPVGRVEADDVAAILGDQPEAHLALAQCLLGSQSLQMAFVKLRRDPRHDPHEDEDRRQHEQRVGEVGIDQEPAAAKHQQPAQHRGDQKPRGQERARQRPARSLAQDDRNESVLAGYRQDGDAQCGEAECRRQRHAIEQPDRFEPATLVRMTDHGRLAAEQHHDGQDLCEAAGKPGPSELHQERAA